MTCSRIAKTASWPRSSRPWRRSASSFARPTSGNRLVATASRAGLAELLVFLDEEPALARLFLVEALGAGPRVLERRAELLDDLAEVIDCGRFVTNAVREPPEVAAEGVVGAVFAVLHTRALEDGRSASRVCSAR
jgi:hypothetical protein